MGRVGDWIQTYKGHCFYPLDPRAEEVDLEDIAHALSMLCRYNGHVSTFYSVAEHSVLLSFIVPAEFAMEALLHDAAEAYIGDITRPFKSCLGDSYKGAEEGIEAVIAAVFGTLYPLPEVVKEYDTRILNDERSALKLDGGPVWGGIGDPLGVRLRLWSPSEAKQAFLRRFYELNERRFVEQDMQASVARANTPPADPGPGVPMDEFQAALDASELEDVVRVTRQLESTDPIPKFLSEPKTEPKKKAR